MENHSWTEKEGFSIQHGGVPRQQFPDSTCIAQTVEIACLQQHVSTCNVDKTSRNWSMDVFLIHTMHLPFYSATDSRAGKVQNMDNLVISTGLIMWIGHLKEIRKLVCIYIIIKCIHRSITAYLVHTARRNLLLQAHYFHAHSSSNTCWVMEPRGTPPYWIWRATSLLVFNY